MKKSRKYNYDIFISYNRSDKSFVDFLVDLFERCGIRVFRDVTGLKVFDKLDASLKDAIYKSKMLIAIVSPSYLQSYWCMFEALEAIQGQDVEQRFFPIVLRYRLEDQTMDEDFVLAALGDLDFQMKDFEAKIIKAKAYELAPKLEKLRFLRSHLPSIFRKIHERIFPEFSLWDEDSIRQTLKKIIDIIAPSSTYDFSKILLNFEYLAPLPHVIPRLPSLPVILWKVKVGRQAWKNRPVVVGNQVIVGSAGARWNDADSEDGMYCLDAENGTIKWFAKTPADANSVLVSKGFAVTGCDDGTVLAVSVNDGSLRWDTKLDGGIVGGPLWLGSLGSGLLDTDYDPILIVTYPGSLYVLDLLTGREIQKMPVGGTVIAQPTIWKFGHSIFILVPTAEGNLMYFQQLFEGHLSAAGGTSIRYADEYSDPRSSDFVADGISMCSLSSPPIVAGDVILQGMVRQTVYDAPPLVALEGMSSICKWVASAPEENDHGTFGNMRTAPVVIGDDVIFATAYSNSICAVSLSTGELTWSVDLGQGMFEQWSTPVAVDSSVYIARHDGYLHKVNVPTRSRDWSLFLGKATQAGMSVTGGQRPPEFDADFKWRVAGSEPLFSTPTIDRGRLYIGSYEGYIYAIGNLGIDHS